MTFCDVCQLPWYVCYGAELRDLCASVHAGPCAVCLPSAHVVCVCVVWWCAQCVQVLWGLVVVCSYVRERKILSVTAYIMCVYVCASGMTTQQGE